MRGGRRGEGWRSGQGSEGGMESKDEASQEHPRQRRIAWPGEGVHLDHAHHGHELVQVDGPVFVRVDVAGEGAIEPVETKRWSGAGHRTRTSHDAAPGDYGMRSWHAKAQAAVSLKQNLLIKARGRGVLTS